MVLITEERFNKSLNEAPEWQIITLKDKLRIFLSLFCTVKINDSVANFCVN